MTQTLFQLLLGSFAAAAVFMSAMFFIAKKMQRYDLVDVAWGLCFIIIAAFGLAMRPDDQSSTWLSWLVTLMVAAWGVRLSGHILARFVRTQQEDQRYVELRQKWRDGHLSLQVFFRIFMVQAALASLISIPVIVIISHTSITSLPLIYLGVAIWIVGFIVEAVADYQLQQFLRGGDAGRLMSDGLWKFSRHPNYFGELAQWWGIGIMSLGVSYGALGLVGPLLITYLIVYVSGIPLSEKRLRQKPGWSQYAQKTSLLIPLPPKA